MFSRHIHMYKFCILGTSTIARTAASLTFFYFLGERVLFSRHTFKFCILGTSTIARTAASRAILFSRRTSSVF